MPGVREAMAMTMAMIANSHSGTEVSPPYSDSIRHKTANDASRRADYPVQNAANQGDRVGIGMPVRRNRCPKITHAARANR